MDLNIIVEFSLYTYGNYYLDTDLLYGLFLQISSCNIYIMSDLKAMSWSLTAMRQTSLTTS